jgi:hypothetical protein
MKPKLFIGSSTEGQMHALAMQKQLGSGAEVTVWNQGFFELNASYLDSLLSGLSESDFGVFVLTPDDTLTLRGQTLATARDNVLFEFGLAMGKLGRERAFFVLPADSGGFRLPTDLLGISTVHFDGERDKFEAAVGPACFKILQAVQKYGIRQDRLTVPAIETVSRPRILCACSSQYFHLSFEKDVELIQRETEKVAARLTHLHNTDSQALMAALMDGTFDVVHLSAYVDPKTGEIFFNDVGPGGGMAAGVPVDSLPAASFAKMVKLAKAKLVILATCDTLLLAAKLAGCTNMIAATDSVYMNDILKWELGLYKCLAKGISLSSSFEMASSLSKAPMLLLLKKDFAFTG